MAMLSKFAVIKYNNNLINKMSNFSLFDILKKGNKIK